MICNLCGEKLDNCYCEEDENLEILCSKCNSKDITSTTGSTEWCACVYHYCNGCGHRYMETL